MYDPRKPFKYKVLELIESTWRTPYVKVTRGIYPQFVRKFDAPEVQHTDAIGSKGLIHWRRRTFRDAVIDALAMNLNDLALIGARAYTLQDHIMLPNDDHAAILSVVRALARECRARHIAITGGEVTQAGMPFDIGITVSGFIETPILQRCQAGDILVGIKSTGLHSNGLTRARAVLSEDEIPTTPTRIYADDILPLLKRHRVHAMMHMTGGAFSKLKDILGPHDADIAMPPSLKPQPIFFKLHERGVSSSDMYTTFNCGVGFVLSIPPREAEAACRALKRSAIIGRVVKGKGEVRIKSLFDGTMVNF